MSEAFIYLWYDALNKMYYLGKHKGSPDDKYTHSSTIWESFTKDNIPEGVTRRILAYGTDEEMCILEHELLVNRKKRCWDRYYNNSLGNPRYVDQRGENNPMYGRGAERTGENNPQWKGGISLDMKEYDKKRNQTPERKALCRARQQTPKFKAWRKEYDAKRYVQGKTTYQKLAVRKKAESQGVGTLDKFLK